MDKQFMKSIIDWKKEESENLLDLDALLNLSMDYASELPEEETVFLVLSGIILPVF